MLPAGEWELSVQALQEHVFMAQLVQKSLWRCAFVFQAGHSTQVQTVGPAHLQSSSFELGCKWYGIS